MAKVIGWVAVCSTPLGIFATVLMGSASYAAIGFALTVFLTAVAMMLLEPSGETETKSRKSVW